MDVKLDTKSSVTSGGGVQSGSFVTNPGTGYIAFQYPPPPEVLLEIPPKHHSISVLRLPDGEIRVVFEEVDGVYTGEAIQTLFNDINAVMEAVHGALTEEDEDDDDDFEDEDEDTKTESEETPPPPAIRAQADGEAETFGTIEMESTFCECADCRRRRL